MSYEFDEIAGQIDALLNETSPNLNQIQTKLGFLQERVGTSDRNREEHKRLRERFNQKQLEAFEEAYEVLSSAMFSLSDDEFSRRVAQLGQLGGARDYVVKRTDDLKKRRRTHQAVIAFVHRADDQLKTFEAQIKAQKDRPSMVKQFIDPLITEADRLLQEMGDNPELLAIFEKLRQAKKTAEDQVAIGTLVALGNFEAVLDYIEAQPDDADIVIVGIGGVPNEPRKKLDAMALYEDRAKKFELGKADEYLTKARQELQDGHPIMANLIMQAAQKLKRLPELKKVEIREFIADNLNPLMKRVNEAREKLAQVPYAKSLREGIRLFDEALDAETGWAEFDTIPRDKKRAQTFLDKDKPADMREADGDADGGVDESGLVASALKSIYEAMERLFQQIEAREAKMTTGHKLFYAFHVKDKEQPSDLAFFINWRDKRLLPQYGNIILDVVERYNQQATEIDAMNVAYQDALAEYNFANYAKAYALLQPYADILKVERNRYKDILHLWDTLQAYIDMDKVRQDLTVVMTQGITNAEDLQKLESDLARLGASRDRGRSVRDKNLDKAIAIGLDRTVQDVESLYNLARGLYERKKGNLTEAKGYIEESARGFSGEYPQHTRRAEDVLSELTVNIKADTDLDVALAEAQIELDAKRFRRAYEVLAPHHIKTASTNYGQYLRLMGIIRPQLSDELRRKILDLLAKDPNKARDLGTLASLLEKVDIGVYETLRERIDNVLAIQDAFNQMKSAQAQKSVVLWRQAMYAWEKVIQSDVGYEAQYDETLEAYMLLHVDDVLAKVAKTSPDNLLDARQGLSDVLDEIDKLAKRKRNQRVPLLRLRVYAHRLIVTDDVDALNRTIALADGEAKQCDDADRQSADYDVAQRLVERARALHKAAVALKIAFTPAQPLTAWRNAQVMWHNAVDDDVDFMGMRLWKNALFASAQAQLNDQIRATAVTWQQIEPTTKLILISPDPDTHLRSLNQFHAALQSVFNEVIKNTRGDYVPRDKDGADDGVQQGKGEADYLAQLERATESLRDILDWYGLPDRATYTVDGVNEKVIAIRNKRAQIDLIMESVAQGRMKLQTACATGEFDTVNQQIADIIEPNGTYSAYRNHLAVVALLNDMERDRKERGRLLEIAQAATISAQREEFEQAIDQLNALGKGDNKFAPDSMVTYQDIIGAGELITNTHDMLDMLKDKQQVIEKLQDGLGKIITIDKLMSLIRPNPDKLPAAPKEVRLTDTHIVDFETRQVQLVEANRAKNLYDDALRELDRLGLGNIQSEDDPPTYYDNQHLSLAQARDMLRDLQVYKTQLNSATATAIFNFAANLSNLVRHYLRQCDQLYTELTQSKEEFDIEFRRFREAYRVLQEGTRDRQRYLDILDEAYWRIRGDGSGKLPANGREAGLYPLAYLYTDLDDEYKAYRKKR